MVVIEVFLWYFPQLIAIQYRVFISSTYEVL